MKFRLLIGFITGIIGLFFISPFLQASKTRIELGGSLFIPSESVFREIYGNGMKWSFDIGTPIGRDMEIFLEIRYSSQEGELTFTQERTTLKTLPIGVSVRYIFLKEKINLYGGGGLTYNLFEEKNPIGRIRENKLGFSLRVGGFTRLKGLKKFLKEFIIDVYINYNYCKMKPAEFEFNIGGIDIGVAFGFEF